MNISIMKVMTYQCGRYLIEKGYGEPGTESVFALVRGWLERLSLHSLQIAVPSCQRRWV